MVKNKKHPSLYQINTRVWLNQFGPDFDLEQIPVSYWDYLADQGIDYVWLLGIWQLANLKVAHWDLNPDRINDYSREVGYPVNPEIIDGSPYAIDRYIPSANIGKKNQFQRLRDILHQREMKLMLDFVPNHYSAGTSWLLTHPEYFIQGSIEDLDEKPEFYFNHRSGIFAHGKDPYFGPWRDTVQVDYFNPAAREWMAQELKTIAGLCDAVRCDMAMLIMNHVFTNTWHHAYHGSPNLTHTPEFWPQVIRDIKETNPEFLMMAEVYWDLEWDLQMMGFDYTYDKRLLDRLKNLDHQGVKDHLKADISFQSKSVRFIENHDEKRGLSIFSMPQNRAAALVTYTLPGMRFFHDGQWEGRIRRLPVQLTHFPKEIPCACPHRNSNSTDHPTAIFCECNLRFYQKLTQLIKHDVFTRGAWNYLESEHEQLFTWQWSYGRSWCIVLINYSRDFIESTKILERVQTKKVYDILNEEYLTFSDNSWAIGFRPFQARVITPRPLIEEHSN